MNKKGLLAATALLMAVFVFVSCGGKKAEFSEKGKLLTATSWKPDLNANIKGTTDNVDSTTGITADIQLQGDVAKIGEFMAGSLTFGRDENDPTKLSYERKYGEGLLSTSVLGFWEFNADETAIIMREWDSAAGKEKEPVTYQIVELSAEKLVLKKEGTEVPDIYLPK